MEPKDRVWGRSVLSWHSRILGRKRGAMAGITKDVFCDSLEESSFDVHVLH